MSGHIESKDITKFGFLLDEICGTDVMKMTEIRDNLMASITVGRIYPAQYQSGAFSSPVFVLKRDAEIDALKKENKRLHAENQWLMNSALVDVMRIAELTAEKERLQIALQKIHAAAFSLRDES